MVLLITLARYWVIYIATITEREALAFVFFKLSSELISTDGGNPFIVANTYIFLSISERSDSTAACIRNLVDVLTSL